jgi:hypothetical protein
MVRRPKIDAEERRDFGARLDRLMARIYVFFAIGLVMRVAQVRPEKISVSGVELAISNTNVLPGVLLIAMLGLLYRPHIILYLRGLPTCPFQYSSLQDSYILVDWSPAQASPAF